VTLVQLSGSGGNFSRCLPCRVLNPAPASLSACRGVLVSVAAFAINRCTSPSRYTTAHEEGSSDQNVEAIIVGIKGVSSPELKPTITAEL
jgi:hypothetical protein